MRAHRQRLGGALVIVARRPGGRAQCPRFKQRGADGEAPKAAEFTATAKACAAELEADMLVELALAVSQRTLENAA